MPARPRITLLELLVIVATCLMFVAILVPSLGKHGLGSHHPVCINNLRAVGQAAGQFAAQFTINSPRAMARDAAACPTCRERWPTCWRITWGMPIGGSGSGPRDFLLPAETPARNPKPCGPRPAPAPLVTRGWVRASVRRGCRIWRQVRAPVPPLQYQKYMRSAPSRTRRNWRSMRSSVRRG